MEHLPNFSHDSQQFLLHNDMDVDISFFHHTQSVHVQSILHEMYPKMQVASEMLRVIWEGEKTKKCHKNKLLTIWMNKWDIYVNFVHCWILGGNWKSRNIWAAFTEDEKRQLASQMFIAILCMDKKYILLLLEWTKRYTNKNKRDTVGCCMLLKTKQHHHSHHHHYIPEHLNSWSCKSATFCPFNWLGEWHRVYGANRGALRRNFESHDKWQSHANGLSESRNARSRGMFENISRGIVVMLLLFNVRISNSWRFLNACSSIQTIWLWSNWRLRSAVTPLNIRFDIAAISLFDKSLLG